MIKAYTNNGKLSVSNTDGSSKVTVATAGLTVREADEEGLLQGSLYGIGAQIAGTLTVGDKLGSAQGLMNYYNFVDSGAVQQGAVSFGNVLVQWGKTDITGISSNGYASNTVTLEKSYKLGTTPVVIANAISQRPDLYNVTSSGARSSITVYAHNKSISQADVSVSWVAIGQDDN